MRFSIRDLLWATLVVALVFGWWRDHRVTGTKRVAAIQQAYRLRSALRQAKHDQFGRPYHNYNQHAVPWEVLYEAQQGL